MNLVYVEDNFAWFCTEPEHAWGDDWNDAPHDCNAGHPYLDRGGDWAKVAWDGDLEIVGVHLGDGVGRWGYLSVQDINAGKAPWLVQVQYGMPSDDHLIPLGVTIPAGVSPAEFERLVGEAGGRVYYPRDVAA